MNHSFFAQKNSGITGFDIIVRKALDESAPYIVKLMVLRNKIVTRDFIKDKAKKTGLSITTVVNDIVFDAINFARIIAAMDGDKKSLQALKSFYKDFETIAIDANDKQELLGVITRANEFAKTPAYSAAMNVLVAAMHTGYSI